tara:strand:+ start:673 stop:846 length:174 start_codon:yes stop_codon:yes gene_type:complete
MICESRRKTKMEMHKPIQRKDGSIYCKCPNLPNENTSVSVNYLKRTMICSVCSKELE